ncbi:MAG: DUF6434 domain-containing protein [Eubacteriales bacterium]|nr:DUF6434 domain-containing protein [Eubacteriales bacterium]
MFREYYYLKEELADFCRNNGLPASGAKAELTERVARFLDTGEIPAAAAARRRATVVTEISEDTIIEPDIVCSERHRAFFKAHIGNGFSFNTVFQKWLKSNAGKTYREAIAAYYEILAQKKKGTTAIDSQFEYNTYIRDFFADNKGRTLQDAIRCWNAKKQRQGSHRYEPADIAVLNGALLPRKAEQ